MALHIPRLSLRVLTVAVLIVGLAGSSFGASALWYRHSETALTGLGAQLRTQLLGRVQDALRDRLDRPRRANRMLGAALDNGLDPQQPETAIGELLAILDTLDPDYVAVGLPDGGFVGAERMHTGAPRIAFTDPGGAGTLTTFEIEEDADGVSLGRAVSGVAYDARKRPWFQSAIAAEGPVWSPVYRIATPPPRLGITLAEAVRDDQGQLRFVLESDLIVSNFGAFLAELDLDVEAVLVVLDEQGDLVATSTGEPMLRMVDGTTARAHGSTSRSPAIAALSRALSLATSGPPERDRRLDLDVDGETWLAEVAPVEGNGPPWVVGVLLPEAAVLGAVRRSTHDTLLLSGLVLLGALGLGIWLNQRITRPLDRLTEDLTRIARFELDPSPPSRTPFREIHAIEDAAERMKRGLRSFERYVSSDLVRSLIRSNREATLGVSSTPVTVFFSDIAGFTHLSETLPPEILVEIVGDYLGEWSNLILFSGGTVDKFIGDAIMAFWNAPEEVADHPAVACGVALRCQARLRELNEGWIARDLPPVAVRIGLHTDTALVGNLGSAKRMDYTVVGDGVNLASRLEGLNKTYGTSILISEQVRQAVADRFVTRPLDRVIVRGRSQATTVHELIGTLEQASEADLQRAATASRAFAAYLARDFESAARISASLAPDVAAELLAERCRRLAAAPPDADWDGVVPAA